MADIIFLDNFDSFTYNLVDELRRLQHRVTIYRNDCDLEQLVAECQGANRLLALSPGPSSPEDAGNMLPLIERVHRHTPILGICLGHQALIAALGGKVIHAGEVMHGKISRIEHDGQAMFAHLPQPLPVARYHSLKGADPSPDWIINAWHGDIIMAVRHRQLALCGFQFHPESLLTVHGGQLLAQSIDWLLQPRHHI